MYKKTVIDFIRKYFILIALAVFVFVWILFIAYQKYLQYEVSEKSAINSINGINSLESILLGGVKQWILIRGKDRSNPLLLYLHGGPGAPLFPNARRIGFKTGLEKKYVLVYWEQRGTGKSYSFSIPEESMTIEQFISDTGELSNYLIDKFKVKKIFLVGRSWGSFIGLLTVKRHPELFYAFVGIGQLIHPLKNDSLSYEHTLQLANVYAESTEIEEIKSIGYPPYLFEEVTIQRKWLTKFDSHFMKEKFNSHLTDTRANLLSTPEYSLWDVIMMGIDPFFSSRHLWNKQYYKYNLFEFASELKVPVYFLHGRYDYFTPGKLVEKYYHYVTAPMGKTMIWFEKSGHEPEFQEPQKFREIMINRILKETYGCK
jgi:pimeloyl-ACP methyl ester carboxylesterase